MMSGKARRNRELSHSENLAELYRQFYDKGKNVLDGQRDESGEKGTNFINQARSSIGSLGGRLEQRRQALKNKMKKQDLVSVSERYSEL